MSEALKSCLICRPRVFTVEGADHTGQDAFMRCTRCHRRTTHHVECERITEKVRQILRREWFSGRVEESRP
jgi:hypothetical protein